jgi:hypothetical protein
MEKKWQKKDEGKYAFLMDDEERASLDIVFGSNDCKAVAKIDNAEYIIKKTGFWKNSIEIENSGGQLIGRAYYDKWYANSFKLDYRTDSYKVIIRNNPLAEWAILSNDRVLLAYGLSPEDGKIIVRITGNSNTDNLLDCFLWYLFVPIASENMGDDFVFTMLMVNQ